MNLSSLLQPTLWASVRGTYEAGNYKHAVLDAVGQLTTTLRERALLDVDGVDLVNKALGGEDPKLRLSRLETQTEKDVQQGFAHILRGIYLCIRNPRSHEAMKDDVQTADRIICFIDYLLQVIGASQQSFSIERFLARVSDPDFPLLSHYADVLAAEVPQPKRLDALIQVFRHKDHAPANNVTLTVRALSSVLDERGRHEFLAAVSREYEDIPLTHESVALLFGMLTPDLWPMLGEASRLRVEHYVVRDMKTGYYNPAQQRTHGGATATWAQEYLGEFWYATRLEAAQCLIAKLADGSVQGGAYCVQYFLRTLVALADEFMLQHKLASALSRAIEIDEGGFVSQRIRSFPWANDWLPYVTELLSGAEVSDLHCCDEPLDEEDIPF